MNLFSYTKHAHKEYIVFSKNPFLTSTQFAICNQQIFLSPRILFSHFAKFLENQSWPPAFPCNQWMEALNKSELVKKQKEYYAFFVFSVCCVLQYLFAFQRHLLVAITSHWRCTGCVQSRGNSAKHHNCNLTSLTNQLDESFSVSPFQHEYLWPMPSPVLWLCDHFCKNLRGPITSI